MQSGELKSLPIKVADNEEQLIRIQYTFCPKSISSSTISRSIIHDESNPLIGYVDHALQNGNVARFQGRWKEHNEHMKECIFLFSDNEVNIIPLKDSLVTLKKTA